MRVVGRCRCTPASGAVLVGAVSWVNWRRNNSGAAASQPQTVQVAANPAANSANGANISATAQPDSPEAETLLADNELSDFTLLPGSSPLDTADAAILRVRMQRSSLGTLGLPVNEERAGEWIQVDLLVGNDGLPQAVRLPQE